MQRGPRSFLHRQMRRLWCRAQKLGLGAGYVDDRMQADGLGDDAAPSGIESPQDVGVGFGRRRRGKQERVLEPETGERHAELRGHGENLSKTPTIAHYNEPTHSRS